MTKEDAILLIQSIIRRKDDDDIENLVELLGCFPLALVQAGAYIINSKINIRQYIEDYKVCEKDILGYNKLSATTNESVLVTWAASIKAIQKDAETLNIPPVAPVLLLVCAYLAPDYIPRIPLFSCFKKFFSGDEFTKSIFDQLLGQLYAYSLIKLDEDFVSVHRLVQSVFRIHHEKGTLERVNINYPCLSVKWYADLLESINVEFYRKTSILEDLIRRRSLFSHLEQLLEHTNYFKKKSILYPSIGDLLCNIAMMLLDNNAKMACKAYEIALKIQRCYYGNDHLEVASTLGHLGVAYGKCGNFKESMECLQSAVVIYEAHSKTTNTLTRLGKLYSLLGVFKKAKQYLEEALKNEHNPLAKLQILTDLGLAYNRLGKYEEAKQCLEEALRLNKPFGNKNHLEEVSILVNLGIVYNGCNKFEESKEFLESAWKIYEKYYAENDLETPNIFYYLSVVYNQTIYDQLWKIKSEQDDFFLKNKTLMLSDIKQVKQYLKYALKITQIQYGMNHQNLSPILVSLGMIDNEFGQYTQAKAKLMRALNPGVAHLVKHFGTS